MNAMINDCFLEAVSHNSHAKMFEFFGMLKMAFMLDAIDMNEYDFLFRACYISMHEWNWLDM